METSERLEKFLLRVNALLDTLSREHDNKILLRGVDRYYYIQKKEELILLMEGVEDAARTAEAEPRLKFFKEKFDLEYNDAFNTWRKDIRWINAVLRDQKNGH